MIDHLGTKLTDFIETYNKKKESGKKYSLPFCVKIFSQEIIEIIQLGYKYSDIYDYLNIHSKRKISKGHWYETIKILEVTNYVNPMNEKKEQIQDKKRGLFDNLVKTESKNTITHDAMHIFNEQK